MNVVWTIGFLLMIVVAGAIILFNVVDMINDKRKGIK